jgi:hypothetical protein
VNTLKGLGFLQFEREAEGLTVLSM